MKKIKDKKTSETSKTRFQTASNHFSKPIVVLSTPSEFQYAELGNKVVQGDVVGLGRQDVGQLAAEAYAQGLGLQAVFHDGKGGVVTAAGLSEAVAASVDTGDRDQQ